MTSQTNNNTISGFSWKNYLMFVTTLFFIMVENVKAFVTRKDYSHTFSIISSKSTEAARLLRSASESWMKRSVSSMGDLNITRLKAFSSNVWPSMESLKGKAAAGAGISLGSFSNQLKFFETWYNELDPTSRPQINREDFYSGDSDLSSWAPSMSDYSLSYNSIDDNSDHHSDHYDTADYDYFYHQDNNNMEESVSMTSSSSPSNNHGSSKSLSNDDDRIRRRSSRRIHPVRSIRKAAKWAFGFGLSEMDNTSF